MPIFEKRNQFTEDAFVSDSNSCHDDDASTLDSFCHVIGCKGNFGRSFASVTKEAELVARKGNARLFNVQEIRFSESRLIPDADFLSCKGTVSSHRLADSTATQYSNWHVFQIAHIHLFVPPLFGTGSPVHWLGFVFLAFCCLNYSELLFCTLCGNTQFICQFSGIAKMALPFSKSIQYKTGKGSVKFFAFSFFEERVKKCKKYVMGCKASKGQNGYK